MPRLIFLIFILGFSFAASASQQSLNERETSRDSECPDWLKDRSQTPECPDTGLVPETYPVGAIMVSDMGYAASRKKFEASGIESGFTADVVIETLQGAGDRLPIIFLPVQNETMKVIRSRINSLSVSAETKKNYLKALRQVPNAQSFTWQRDFVHSSVDPDSGQLFFNQLEGYAVDRGLSYSTVGNMFGETAQCGIYQGEPLTHYGAYRTGHKGGNIDALPGGICLLGSDNLSASQWSDYMRQICKSSSPDSHIAVPTEWLHVGHTDEILRTVRNHKKPAPCDFSVVLASPKKAIELLTQNPDQPFVDFTGGRGGTPAELAERRVTTYGGLELLCDEVLNIRYPKTPDSQSPTSPGSPSESGGAGVSLNSNLQLLLLGAQANAEKINHEAAKQCTSMTNGEVARVLTENGEMAKLNDLIQEKMEDLKKEIKEKVGKKIPGCQPDILEVPDIFYGAAPTLSAGGSYYLPSHPGRAYSILPNPANGLSVNDTIISPEPGNAVFKNYIESQYKSRGLNARFVDTFDYAHMGRGNLHCSTNSVHLCSPRKKSQ